MRRAALVLCLIVLLAPSAARADENGPKPPPGAPVVAGPLPGGATLVAFDRGDDLCVAVRGRRSSCAPPPDVAWRFRYEVSGVLYGVATADVASVEVLTTDGRQSVPAGAGAYQGRFAGRVHFFLAALSGPAFPYRLRVLDAQGRALGAQDLGEAPPVGRSVRVAGGRVSGAAWAAVAFQRTALAPTPLDRARTELITCVRVDMRAPLNRSAGCSGRDRDPAGLSFSVDTRCSPRANAVTGLAGPAVRGLEAVLGDGTHRTVGLRALPASFGDPRRAFALVLADDVAVRALLLRQGGRTDTLALGAAPAQAQCSQQSGAFGVALGIFGFVARPAPSGGGPLVARDEGDDLCVGLGTIVPTDCQLPPTEPTRARIERRRAGASTDILAVVSSEVAALRLQPDRGAPVTVATSDLPGYTGRYAGLVRAAVAVLPGDRRVYRTVLLAADGHVIDSLPGPDQRPLPRTPRIVARVPGGVTVAALADCVQVRAGAPTRERSACGFTDIAESIVAVPCAAHRSVIVARLGRTARGLTATTSAGTVRGQRHGGLAVAVLPPHAALREIRLIGAARIRVRLPAAAHQCGYTAYVTTPHR